MVSSCEVARARVGQVTEGDVRGGHTYLPEIAAIGVPVPLSRSFIASAGAHLWPKATSFH
jgi:hypothetical protein